MSFRDDISKLVEPDYFKGGNDKQREHLNELVDAIRQMISSASRNTDPADDNNILIIDIIANSVVVTCCFTAYVTASNDL